MLIHKLTSLSFSPLIFVLHKLCFIMARFQKTLLLFVHFNSFVDLKF